MRVFIVLLLIIACSTSCNINKRLPAVHSRIEPCDCFRTLPTEHFMTYYLRENKQIVLCADKVIDKNQVFYTLDGRIQAHDEIIQRDIEEVLNLNQSILLKNRKHVLDCVLKRMKQFYPKKNNQGWTKAEILKEITFWKSEDAQGHLKPYLQIALYYLQNKLNRLV